MKKLPDTKPKVTIGITSYNNQDFIRQAIDSVLNQSYDNIEIIVIDDCSTDATESILNSYSDKINLTKHSINSGSLVMGRREVIAQAEGEFIGHLDADDYLETDFVEKQVSEFIRDNQLDWVASGVNIVDQYGKSKDKWTFEKFPTNAVDALSRGFKYSTVPLPKNGLFRKSFLNNNNLSWYCLENTLQGEDFLTTIKYLQANPKIKILSDCLWNYRLHGNNMSCDIKERIKMIIGIKQYYIEHFNELVYMFDPRMLKYKQNSCDYLALKHYMLAKDLFHCKNSFELPKVIKVSSSKSEIKEHLQLFDKPIMEHLEKSLAHSNQFEKELLSIKNSLSLKQTYMDGRKKLKMGDFTGARSKFIGLLDSGEDTVDIYCALSEALYGLGDLDGAEKFCLNGFKQSSEDTSILNNSGVIFYTKNDFGKAEAAFVRSINSDSNNKEARYNLLQLWGETSSNTPLNQNRAGWLMDSINWIANNDADSSRDNLLIQNKSLRNSAMKKFCNIAIDSTEKILLHRPSNGAVKYLMESWADALNHMGVETEILDWQDKTREKFESFQPTIFITVGDHAYLSQLDNGFIEQYKANQNLRIGHIFDFENGTDIRETSQIADFLITFHLDPSQDEIMSKTNLPLISIPFGVNPKIHYMREGRELWDYFFVGTNSPFKKEETENYLLPIIEYGNGILAGMNWETGFGELRITEASMMYNFAKIYPNYHVQRQMEQFNEINERAFVIPAIGGFQLVDNPKAMPFCFAPDEMAVAKSATEYHTMYNHYLNNPSERISFIERGMKKVWKNYTLFDRLLPLLKHLDIDINSNSTIDLSKELIAQ